MSLFLINASFDCLTGRFEVESTRVLPSAMVKCIRAFGSGYVFARPECTGRVGLALVPVLLLIISCLRE